MSVTVKSSGGATHSEAEVEEIGAEVKPKTNFYEEIARSIGQGRGRGLADEMHE